MKIFRYADPAGAPACCRESSAGYERLEGDLFAGFHATGEAVEPVRLLPPLDPAAILCIGLNYRCHAEETGARLPAVPVLFMKNPAAVCASGATIEIPARLPSNQVDYECELAVVIGRRCKNLRPEDVGDYILGYTCANDVSARDWQKLGGGKQWCRGKSFDTFCPLGPCLVTPDELPDPHSLRVRTMVNGLTVQDSTTADMIFRIPEIIAFLSASATLLPGTVILTGTPSGVGMAASPPRWLQPGDIVTVEIEGIGRLENPVGMEKGAEPLMPQPPQG